MPRYIIKLDDWYLEYSTIVDAPVTFGMKLDEFKKYYEAEYGRHGMRELRKRLIRIEKHGNSSGLGHTTSQLLSNNRAGPKGSNINIDEIILAYCLRKPIRDGWLVE